MISGVQGMALEQRARVVMARHARSFAFAARFLSRPAKRDAALLYAFARAADDFCDDESLGSMAQRMTMLNDVECAVLADNAVIASSVESSMADAAGKMLRRHGVDRCVVTHFLQSLRIDSQPRQLQTQQELLQFAYGVAGTVGQMMCPILAARLDAEPYAMALGVAMQLTNIARDVQEDAERGRCYLPAEWGADWNPSAGPQTGAEQSKAFAMLERLLALAEDFYAYAEQGLASIAPENRRAVQIALVLYRAIGRKILRTGCRGYWRGRTYLTGYEKLRLLINTATMRKQVASVNLRNVVLQDLSHLRSVPGFPALPTSTA
jgi:15-cis-phytoene synthase